MTTKREMKNLVRTTIAFVWLFVVLTGLGTVDSSVAFAQGLDNTGTAVLPDEGAVDAVDDTANSAMMAGSAYVPGRLLVGFDDQGLAAATAMDVAQVTAVETLDLRGLDGASGSGGVQGYVIEVPEGQELATATQLAALPGVVFAVPDWLGTLVEPRPAEDNSAVRQEDTLAPSGLAPAMVLAPTDVAAFETVPIESADDPVEVLDLDMGTSSAEDEAALPSLVWEKAYAVSDPLYEERQWYAQRVNASRAWAVSNRLVQAAADTATIKVAVIDSGVDATHPDLVGHVLPGRNYITSTLPPDDELGHGTHVAGLIGAGVNNQIGIAGIAARVQIEPLKVVRDDGKGQGVGQTSHVAQALRDAVDGGAHVVNLSLSMPPSPVLEAAVNYAYDRGALIIASAGNCGLDPNSPCPPPVVYPAAYPVVMAVGATNYYDTSTYYSARGSQIEIVAPGGDVNGYLLSTWSEDAVLRCDARLHLVVGKAGYCQSFGTSMAAAVVSGAAAVVWAVDPSLTGEDVRSILRRTARPLNEPLDKIGSGRVDVHTAVRLALPSSVRVSENNISLDFLPGAEAYTKTIVIDNPSLDPIGWSVMPTTTVEWLDYASPIQGTAQYGHPQRMTFVLSTTHLYTGTYATSFRFTATRSDGSRVIVPVNIAVNVHFPKKLDTVLYMPLIGTGAGGIDGLGRWFFWETEGVERAEVHGMTNDSNIGVSLPFTFTLKGRSYTDARIYSDGILVFPAQNSGLGGANHCLANMVWPQQAVYGWWADLNPSVAGSRVVTFAAGTDRFVVQFDNVPAANGAYRVSFQIVLYEDGKIALNYGQISPEQNAPPPVTIGVIARDGRFVNQVVCATDTLELGTLPGSFQSLLIKPEDLF